MSTGPSRSADSRRGIPTKIITLILPCLGKPRGIVPDDIQPR